MGEVCQGTLVAAAGGSPEGKRGGTRHTTGTLLIRSWPTRRTCALDILDLPDQTFRFPAFSQLAGKFIRRNLKTTYLLEQGDLDGTGLYVADRRAVPTYR